MTLLVEFFCRRSGGIWSSTVAGFYARRAAVGFSRVIPRRCSSFSARTIFSSRRLHVYLSHTCEF